MQILPLASLEHRHGEKLYVGYNKKSEAEVNNICKPLVQWLLSEGGSVPLYYVLERYQQKLKLANFRIWAACSSWFLLIPIEFHGMKGILLSNSAQLASHLSLYR